MTHNATSSAFPPNARRRRLLAASLLLPVLAACKNPLGPDGLSLTREQLNQALATRFPMERRVLEVLTVQLSTPQVTLLPQDQRLGTALTLAVRDRIFDLQAHGRVALTYRLRYEPSDGSIRMSDVRVDQLELASGATALQGYLQRIGSVLAEQFFNDLSLYSLTASQRQLLGTLGQPVISISADRLSLKLQPAS